MSVDHTAADELVRTRVLGLRWYLVEPSKEFSDQLLLLRCHCAPCLEVSWLPAGHFRALTTVESNPPCLLDAGLGVAVTHRAIDSSKN